MSAPDTLMVLAASYPDVASAEADYEAVSTVTATGSTTHWFVSTPGSPGSAT
jgi:hypothetical protein